MLTILTLTMLVRWLTKKRAAAVLALVAAAADASAQQRLPADSFPAPARPVSSIVAPRWIAEDRRDAFGEADAVIRAMGIRRGQVVADIGAGDGYYVAKLAPLLGDSGRVLANDIEPRYLALLRRRVAQAGWRNVQVIEGLPHDPLLPTGRVDAAIMIHMYHEIEQPFGLLYHLAFAMKPNGLVGVLDVDGPTDRHGTPPRLLRCELQAVGYRYVRQQVLPDGAYLALFRAPAEAQRLTTAAALRRQVQQANCR
ncbi:class I SAM-dependent methyltransferase [Pseudogemmatithrix spongiicola]|uniref:Class I SAM-dependent methyltransferase n=1 Tax=Pseudogemmatithrix spongiicola TaxID=3062599 RepID=A0AA49JUC5_9BACT|nr:class I SAM-dependent methyltransferase [Gemmatimonadaceae bacterium 'strain 138']WKW14977.1 class I SAM-dependent methyltransferase [Gemmatimonadaceae bacterium 'strain 318']